MVARQKSIHPQASEYSDRESHTQSVAQSTSSQYFGQDETSRHSVLPRSSAAITLVKQNNYASSPEATIDNAPANHSPEETAPGAASIGTQMPKQGSLFPDLLLPDRATASGPLLPERTKQGFYELLKPITREKSFRSVARLKKEAPIIVCVERIREAKAKSGLTNQQIADLCEIKSRQTVAKILKVEPGIKFYEFCAVMNVIGLEIAELFPMRKRSPAPRMRWPRGYHHTLENMQRQVDVIARAKEQKRARRKKRWG